LLALLVVSSILTAPALAGVPLPPLGPLGDVSAVLCGETVVLIKFYDYVPPHHAYWQAITFSVEGEDPFLLMYYATPGDHTTARVYISRDGETADEVLTLEHARMKGLFSPCAALRYVYGD
jgi:hypothetical protein